jgi:hypothetical protein
VRFIPSPTDRRTAQRELKKSSPWKLDIGGGELGGLQYAPKAIQSLPNCLRCLNCYLAFHTFSLINPIGASWRRQSQTPFHLIRFTEYP